MGRQVKLHPEWDASGIDYSTVAWYRLPKPSSVAP